MKRMLFGTGLLLSGVVGFVGWSIAVALTVEAGARSRIWGCLDGGEWIVLLVFAAMAAAGFLVALTELCRPGDSC